MLNDILFTVDPLKLFGLGVVLLLSFFFLGLYLWVKVEKWWRQLRKKWSL